MLEMPDPNEATFSAEDGPQSVRLGMGHLGPDGLSQRWLLGECAHRHTLAIANVFARLPSGLIDCAGQRMMPWVVAATVSGPLHLFDDDDLLRIDEHVRPTQETGWRSAWIARTHGGAIASVELVTIFAKRPPNGGVDLVTADLPHEFLPYFDTTQSERARQLRARGRAVRAKKAQKVPCEAPPDFSQPVTAAARFDGEAMMAFEEFADAFDHVERRAAKDDRTHRRLASRVIHFYGQAKTGDWLDFTTEREASTDATVVRRRSDGGLLAICHTRTTASRGDAP